MKTLFKRLEKTMTAAAFAESGEFETARQILDEKPRKFERPTARPQNRPSKRKVLRAE